MITLARSLVVAAAVSIGCGGGGDAAGSDGGNGGNGDGGSTGGTVRERARALTMGLRGDTDFMIGYGNDNAGAYLQGISIDLHYTYLVGYGDSGGWPTWNQNATYVDYRVEDAWAHDVTPMFTYYQMALELENGNDAVFTDDSRMRQYLSDVRVMYQHLAELDRPAAVQFEPDFFGYLQNRVRDSGVAADQMPAHIRFDEVPECSALPETVTGFTHCLITMAREIAPNVRIGFHASQWGAWYDNTDPGADVAGAAREVADFLLSVGAGDTDFVTVETLDRDAGFWETGGGGATCSVTGGPRGAVYWDETNATLPNFTQHFTWVAALTERANLPAIWWQLPLGVPSSECGGPGGGSSGNWRDNRVSYFFAHVDQLIAAGGAGAAFGTGAGEQTTIDSDGGQFASAANAYAQSPVGL